MNTIDRTIYEKTRPSWDLSNDLLFKSVFGRGDQASNEILIDLLNDVLRLEGSKSIRKITIRNSFNSQESMEDKLSVLDIKAETGEKELFNIEMQVKGQDYYIERSLYYWSKLYSSQLEKKGKYHTLQRTVGIHFLDALVGDRLEHGHHKFVMYDPGYETAVTDKFEIHYIQMPLLDDIIKAEEKGLADWITFIKGINKPEMEEEILRLTQSKEVMNVAYDYYRSTVSDDEMRERLEAQEKFEHDQASLFYQATLDGRKEGELQAKRKAVKELKRNGVSIEIISKSLELTMEEVENL